MTSWGEYVVRVARTDVSTEIASATGIGQSTVYRWLHKGAGPKTPHAAKFALTYGRDVLEAFVAAGFLTEEEARVQPAREPDLTAVPAEDLAAEVSRRLLAAEASASVEGDGIEFFPGIHAVPSEGPPVPADLAANDPGQPSQYEEILWQQDAAYDVDQDRPEPPQ